MRSWSSSELSKVSNCSGEAAEFVRVEIWWSTEFSITSWRMAALLLFIETLPLSGQKKRLFSDLLFNIAIHIAPLEEGMSICYLECPRSSRLRLSGWFSSACSFAWYCPSHPPH